jgi:ABC-type multidrug transport system fused ATPase/permease subunit
MGWTSYLRFIVRRPGCIAVVDAGRIVETGSHDELMVARGAYRRLYALQFAQPPREGAP